ncbi:MAG: glycerate kinase [Planctomycetia bacterium]|nr:glycerate kinase [Planctomycetia bacterium]
MKNFILIPDSFKGTLSSREICDIMASAIRKFVPDARIQSIPVADGGEGTVDAFLTALGGKKVCVPVTGPKFDKLEGFYGILDEKKTVDEENKSVKTAVVEMAACAGLPLVYNRKNPEKTTTYGVGELFLHAIQNGCRKIILGLGGSCTNDAGTGAAAACGVQFYKENGKSFIPTGGTLHEIAKIDASEINPLLKEVEIVTMCDINNPFCGPTGAAYVFAPQKGADAEMVQRLDDGLRHCGKIIQRDLRKTDIFTLPGAGAAGGMGGGMHAFFGSKLQMGIETVLDTVHFDTLLRDTDLVFTGEGKIDDQSLRGKVIWGIAGRTRRANVPLVVVTGDIGENIDPIYDRGVTAIFSINHTAVPLSVARRRARQDMASEMENLLCLLTLTDKSAVK